MISGWLRRFVVVCVLCSPCMGWSAAANNASADLAILIDVSGSMKYNDPDGERVKALQLLLNLVPLGTELRLMSFATHPHELSHQDRMTESDREQGLAQEAKIDNHGAWTDIESALNLGLSRFSKDTGVAKKHIILLTDGFVELGHGVAADKASRQRIWDGVRALAQQLHVHIHTIDLGGKADDALLRHLSLGTDGRFVSAKDKELSKIFLQVLDVATPSERIPFKGKTFSVDSGVRELTLLDFRERVKPAQHIQELVLMSPKQERFTFSDYPKYLRWVHATQYDIVTVHKPAEGVWQMSQDPGPDSRVTILSDLSLEVQGVPTNTAPDTPVHLQIDIRNQGNLIKDPDFIMLTSLSATSGKVGDLWSEPIKIYDGPIQGSVMVPDDGIFHQNLNGYHQPGDYAIRVLLKGSTFNREFDQLMHVTGHAAELPPPVVHNEQIHHPVPPKPLHTGPPWWALLLIGLLIVAVFGGIGFVGFVTIHKWRLLRQVKKNTV